MNKEILEITKEFHDTYEKLASEYTYETREDTKVFDINSNNGKLMYATVNEIVSPILKENQELKKQLEEVELIVGLRQKRNLIHKFDKEYDEEDKKKNPNRDYAGIMPDAEEVYRRYYSMKNQQKEFIEYLEDLIKQQETVIAESQEKSYFLIYEDEKEDLKLSSQKAYIRRIILEEILKKIQRNNRR